MLVCVCVSVCVFVCVCVCLIRWLVGLLVDVPSFVEFALVELVVHERSVMRTFFLFRATNGFSDHVELLVLRVQLHVFHFPPFVLHVDSVDLEILVSLYFIMFRRFSLIISDCDFDIADLDKRTHCERLFLLALCFFWTQMKGNDRVKWRFRETTADPAPTDQRVLVPCRLCGTKCRITWMAPPGRLRRRLRM